MIYQIFNFRPILFRQAITCSIRYIHYCRSRFNNSFYHTSQVFIIRTSCIFRIKFHIIYITTCIFHSSHSTFNNFFTSRIEFIFDMRIWSSNASMDTFVLGKLQCVSSYVDIFFNCTSQRTNGWPSNSLRNFNYWIEITRTWNRKSCLNHIHSQSFQLLSHLNLFHCIQLTSRNLFAITKSGIKNK